MFKKDLESAIAEGICNGLALVIGCEYADSRAYNGTEVREGVVSPTHGLFQIAAAIRELAEIIDKKFPDQ